jgi:amino acid transporter
MPKTAQNHRLIIGIILALVGFIGLIALSIGIYEFYAWERILSSEGTTSSGLGYLYLLLAASLVIIFIGYSLIRTGRR